MESLNLGDVITEERFITDVGKDIYGIDNCGNICRVGRYAVWYPIPEKKRQLINQSHQIVETGDDLEGLMKRHLISDDSLVLKLIQ